MHDKHYDGIGPTHDEIPLALKSTVDKPKDWYKSMFKAMHKAGRSGNIAETGTDISDYLDEEKFKQNVKIRSNPGSISKWSPGEAYVSENDPKPTYSELLYPTTHLARDKKPSLRGESARDTISEIASKPWAEYLSDVESLPVPKKLTDDLPAKQITVCNPAPVAPIKPLNILEGSIITSKRNYVTPAQKAVGAYMQTTSRQLVPETVQDADLYISGAKSGRQTAKATFDFKGRSERELTVAKNEIILVINDIDDKWYECELRGRTGLVPKNYLQFTNQFHVIQYGEARGKYDFRKKKKTQLSFERDEEIQLIRAIDQNWYEARIGSSKGYVPKNHVIVVKEPITNQDDKIGHDLISPANSRSSSRASSRPASRAISESESRSSPTKSNASQAKYDLSAADELANLSASVLNDFSDDARPEWIPKDSERFQAVYDYTPQHEDELKLTSGDFVYVFEKCVDGWFIGAHGSSGNIGTFPGNYTAKA